MSHYSHTAHVNAALKEASQKGRGAFLETLRGKRKKQGDDDTEAQYGGRALQNHVIKRLLPTGEQPLRPSLD